MKRKTKRQGKPIFTQVSATTVLDPAVDWKLLEPGQPHPQVAVTYYLDQHGKRWRSWGDEPPVPLDTPSEGERR